MVDGLDAHDAPLDRGVVCVEVSQEVKLRGRGPDNQDLLRVREIMGDVIEEARERVRILVRLEPPLRVSVHPTIGGANLRFVEIVGTHVKDVSFVLIDPHGRMKLR
jgi:hypothetical protein